MLDTLQTGFITSVEEDEDGNLLLTFPDELLEGIGWSEGDVLSVEAFAGRIIFRKLEDGELSDD